MIKIVKRNLSNHVYIYQIVMNSKDVIVNILVFVFWNLEFTHFLSDETRLTPINKG